jgi:hypothetical protein
MCGVLGQAAVLMQVLRLRLNGELRVQDLHEYYAKHRTDSFNGPDLPHNREMLKGLPPLQIATGMPEGREEELQQYYKEWSAMQACLPCVFGIE